MFYGPDSLRMVSVRRFMRLAMTLSNSERALNEDIYRNARKRIMLGARKYETFYLRVNSR